MESDENVPVFLDRWLRRAEKSVGVVTIFLGIAAFGLGFLFGDLIRATMCAFATFGIVGTIEMIHLQARARLNERLIEQEDRNGLFNDIRNAHSDWQPTVVKEFSHCGFYFRAIGFDQLRIALTVSPPLCPKCKASLAQRTNVLFPGIIRIKFMCSCGFAQPSPSTRAELIHEAEQMANTPK